MIHIGTTGWDFDFWNGSFYPTNNEDKLAYFSRIASFTELGSTFFEIPSEDEIQNWFLKTPELFIFVPKMLRNVTHSPKFEIDTKLIENYFTRINKLKNKLGMILMQFPIKLQRTPSSFEFMISILEKCNEYFNGHLLIEVRNRSWHKEEVKKELSERSASLVSTDKKPMSSIVRDGNVYYLRLMGDKNLIPKREFGKIKLDRGNDIKYWAKHIKFLNKKHQQVYVAIDNHFSGNSAKDAIILSKELAKQNVKYLGYKLKKQVIKR